MVMGVDKPGLTKHAGSVDHAVEGSGFAGSAEGLIYGEDPSVFTDKVHIVVNMILLITGGQRIDIFYQ